jgi:hypothetical protein
MGNSGTSGGLTGAVAGLLLAAACAGFAPTVVATVESPVEVTPAAAAAPVASTERVASADLLADVAILERAYRELHPGLLRYLSPRSLDAAFAQLRQEFARPRTLPEAYLAFARFAAKIRCGHTYANFFNQSKAIQARLFDTPRLPFYFRWIGGKMVVTRDFTNPSRLPVGTQIGRIDGASTAQILARLEPLARADGGNDAKRIDQMNVTGADRYESFDIYFPLLFPIAAGSVELSVHRPGGSGWQALRVDTVTAADRLRAYAADQPGSSGEAAPAFEWRDLPNGAAYLRMPTWAMYQTKWDWRTWLNEHLDALGHRNAPALIIDLRGNEGGNDVGDEILKRLVAKDLPLAGVKRLVRYRAAPQDLLPYLDTWDPSFKDWGDDATELARSWPTAPPVHYYALAGEDGSVDARAVIHPVLPHFGGRVFVLIDAADSSATFQFAQVVRQQKLGTLIGEPTGGNRRGINGGAFFFLRLPHSGIELDLPLIGTFPPKQEPDAGLQPDVAAPLTAASVAARSDPAMEAVARLLSSAAR